MRISIAMVLLNLALNLLLIWNLREAGLAWATSITAIIQCGILFLMVRRHISLGHPLDTTVLRAALRVVLASALMAVAVLAALWLLGPRTTWWTQLAGVAVGSATGGAVFLIAARVLGVQELGWLIPRGSR
jgi:peptidoglycan biosynthesis protein MviN/MurJ (putative lipid II flippase)